MEAAFFLKRMQVASWLCLAVLVVGSALFFSWLIAWSVLVGGVLANISFLLSKRRLIRFFDTLSLDDAAASGIDKKTFRRSGYLVSFWLRMAAMGLVLAFLLKSGAVHALGLILGLSTVVFAGTFTALSVVKRWYFSRRR